jgi:hypothetical protein
MDRPVTSRCTACSTTPAGVPLVAASWMSAFSDVGGAAVAGLSEASCDRDETACDQEAVGDR